MMPTCYHHDHEQQVSIEPFPPTTTATTTVESDGYHGDNDGDVRVVPLHGEEEEQRPVSVPASSSSTQPPLSAATGNAAAAVAAATTTTGGGAKSSNFKRQASSGSLYSCSAKSAASSNSLRSFLGTLISDTASVVIVEDNAGRTRQQHLQVSQSFRSLLHPQQSGRSRSCRWSSSSTSTSTLPILPMQQHQQNRIPRRSSDFGGFGFGGSSVDGGVGNARWENTTAARKSLSSSAAAAASNGQTSVPLTVDTVSPMSTSPPSEVDASFSFSSPGMASSSRTGLSSMSFSSRSISSSKSLLRDMSPAKPVRKRHGSYDDDPAPPPSAAQMKRQGSNVSALSMSDHSIDSNHNCDFPVSNNDRPVLRSGATAATATVAAGALLRRQLSVDTMPRMPQRRPPLAASALAEAEGLLQDSEEFCTEDGKISTGDGDNRNNAKKDYHDQSGSADAFITRSLARSGSGDSCSSHSRARRLESVLGSMAPGKDRQQVHRSSGGSKQRNHKSSSSSTSRRK